MKRWNKNCCKTVWNFIALISFKWSVYHWRKMRTVKTIASSSSSNSVLWYDEIELICNFKEMKIQVLHRWNVLISKGKQKYHFRSDMCSCMIDLIYSLAANVRERLIKQIYMFKKKVQENQEMCESELIIRLIKGNMLIVMLRLFVYQNILGTSQI